MANRKSKNRIRRKHGSPILAALGWLVAIAALLYCVMGIRQFQAEKRQTAIRYQRQKLALEQEAEEANLRLTAERDEWGSKLRAAQAEAARLQQQVARTRQEVAQKEVALAEVEAEKAKLDRQVQAQLADRELVGESVEEIRARADALKRQRDGMIAQFRQHYVPLKQELRQLVEQKNPDRLRQFFFTKRTTPVAPAAAFFAADYYYESKRTRLAEALYEDLIKQYPDSPYTRKAEKRLNDIKARWPYDLNDPPRFQPYKIPDSLDFGEWDPPAKRSDETLPLPPP